MSTVVRPEKTGSKKRLSEGLQPSINEGTEVEATEVHPADYVEPHDSQDGDEFHEEQSFAHKMVILGAVVLPLLGFIGAIWMAFNNGYVSWLHIGMLVGGWYMTGLGITIGFHRMLTHRSFEARPWVRNFWTAMGSLAVEGSPLDWCMVHRKHHRFSDHEGDPHSPHLHDDSMVGMLKGAWHSHVGWMFDDNWSRKERLKYIPDLMNDPLLLSIDRNYYWWVTATLVIPTVIGGLASMSLMGAWLGLLWGGLARVCFSHHMTWSINSICHLFGARDFKSSDDSRNNVIFGVLSHGEGWHNNHHAFPTSARHGLKWWQFDLSWVIIRTMQMCGLAWNVKLPSEKQMEARAR
jgi:stearoyl-CoA desaturase (delta-9 desaturase)